MSRTYPGALGVSHSVLRALIKLNLFIGLVVLGVVVASLVAAGPVMAALSAHHTDGNSALVLGLRLIMVIGILSGLVAHVVLTRLLAIVETVRLGDPFVAENADRLQTIAWAALGLEVLHFVVGAVAAGASSEAHPLDIHWHFSVTRWLAVLLLFVLARVFEQGARMREDLAGTV